jgi:hypothetical protein
VGKRDKDKNQAEEKEFLQELMTPGSPQFHRFLTSERWDARFSPTVEDEQAVVDWATSQESERPWATQTISLTKPRSAPVR